MIRAVLLLAVISAQAADLASITSNAARGREFKDRYVALTESWLEGIEYTPRELAAMRDGKEHEAEMTQGPDDPLAKRILASGEPSYKALAAAYPGKILDRTVLGTYSSPHQPMGKYNDEFSIYWNGAIACDLIKGKLTDSLGATGVLPLAHNTVVEFRVGPDKELPGRVRRNFSNLGYERGYLPIVIASYETGGVQYRETAFAHQPEGESGGWDIAFVSFDITNISSQSRPAAVSVRTVRNDGSAVAYQPGTIRNDAGDVLVAADAGGTFDTSAGRLDYRFNLAPRATRRLVFKIPYVPDSKGLVQAPTSKKFDEAHAKVVAHWQSLIDKGSSIEVPEPRINDIWRALLLQNYVLADGPRFTYGSGLRYNDSTYPYENGFASHVFAMFGHTDYANTLQNEFPRMAVTREGGGRKYQNRRAMVLHHLLENYRLSGKRDLFEQWKNDYYRVAEEIISDRRSTMVEVNGEKPLNYGILPPDKPGVDVQASTQVVYVLAHSITNCQGLQDFGRFLVVTGIDRDRGERYMKEAADFRASLMTAMRRAAIRLPGRPPFVDLQTLFFKQTPEYGPEPYDDLALGRLQGTYFHYWVDMQLHFNFFNPDDDVAQWLTDYVQQRNGFVLGLTRARAQTGHAGWINNVYDAGYYNFRLRQGKIDEFLFGLYTKFAFGMSRYTYVASEGSPFIGYNTENGGFVGADYSFPNSAANADTLLMLRNALVLEELKDNLETGRLSLMRGAPHAWLEPGKRIRVSKMNTYFGPITYSVQASNGRAKAEIDPPPGDWKTLDVHFRRALRSVTVNGKSHAAFAADGTVTLPRSSGKISVEAVYE